MSGLSDEELYDRFGSDVWEIAGLADAIRLSELSRRPISQSATRIRTAGVSMRLERKRVPTAAH